VDYDKSDRQFSARFAGAHCAAAALHDNRFGAVPDSSHKVTMGMGDRIIRPTVVAREVGRRRSDRARFGQAKTDIASADPPHREKYGTPKDQSLRLPRIQRYQ
jgi:hypothetical protein